VNIKNLTAIMLFYICLATTGCGVIATDTVIVSPSESDSEQERVISNSTSEESVSETESEDAAKTEDSSLVPIEEWEESWEEITGEKEDDTADYEREKYDEKVVQTKVNNVIKSSSTISEEIEGIKNIAQYYKGYYSADITQAEMNELSEAEPYTWELEMDSLLKRILKEADASQVDSIKAEQDTWKANYTRCYNGVKCTEGTIQTMINSGLNARFYENRCYMLAKTLSNIRGENYELPKRYYRDNTYASDNATLDISEGIETGSICITLVLDKKEKIEMLAYDPLINGANIFFETTATLDDGEKFNTNDGDIPFEGKITYGWDGAKLIIYKSGDKNLPAGTEISFPIAL